jgi:hypothetical protein
MLVVSEKNLELWFCATKASKFGVMCNFLHDVWCVPSHIGCARINLGLLGFCKIGSGKILIQNSDKKKMGKYSFRMVKEGTSSH